MQIFSRNPRGWTVKPLDKNDIAEFKKARERLEIAPVFVHTNYLINLASFRPELYEKSIEQFVIDLERTEALGAEYLVTHLGSANGQDEDWMIERVADATLHGHQTASAQGDDPAREYGRGGGRYRVHARTGAAGHLAAP